MARWLGRCGLMCLALAAPAAAQPGLWVVWDSELSASRGRLEWVEDGRVRLIDEHGLEISVPGAVAMYRDEGGDKRAQPRLPVFASWEALVTLTDGQRWEAQIVDDPATEELELQVRRLGRLGVALDVIRSVDFGGEGAAGSWSEVSGAVFDTVVLENGDVLTGTVLAIGKVVEIEGDEGTLRVERESVRRIGLVNPPSGPPPVRVWFASGSVLGARSISGHESVVLEAVAPTAGGGWRELGRVEDSEGESALAGVEFAPGRLVAMSSLEVVGVEAGGGRRWTARPEVLGVGRMGQGTMVFPGPMAATMGLPGRGVRAAGEVTLGERPGEWSDCVVRIEQGEEVLWEGRLNAASASASFSVVLGTTRELSVRVLAGAYGPVQDRVELRLGWVLLAGE